MLNSGLFAVALLPLTIPLVGCEQTEAQSAVKAKLPGASYYQFQSVKRRDDSVCGEVNAAGQGPGAGYRRFVYRDATREAAVEPVSLYKESEIADFERTCRLVQQGGSMMDRTACDFAIEARKGAIAKQRFDKGWAGLCG